MRTGLGLIAVLLLVKLPLIGHGLNLLVHALGVDYAAVHLKGLYTARRLSAPGYSSG